MSLSLSDNEKRDVFKFLEAGKPLPDKYRFLLFKDDREVELVWNGKTNEVTNVVLPFQIIEQIDEPREGKEFGDGGTLFDTSGKQITGWTNKLIWGDNKLILSSLKNGPLRKEIEAQGGLKLIYIDPPFDVGADFSMDIKIGERNTIVNSFNRNFAKRNDNNPETLSFVASPELVTALAIAGKLSFNPETDYLETDKGEKVKLDPPFGDELPQKNFEKDKKGFLAPTRNGFKTKIAMPENNDRLQFMEPFKPWDGKDFIDVPLLLKAKGKCTTDHISPAGAWLKFRGHLDNISKNMFLGAINAFTGKAGETKNLFSNEYKQVHEVARDYKALELGWIVVGDENYGEGSSREHAAMEPRFLGGKAIITKSFARIHETNLKKQGMLPLTFANPSDYDKIQEDDKFSLLGLSQFAPERQFNLIVKHSDGSIDQILLNHSFNSGQIEWFKAGGALNLIAASQKKPASKKPVSKKKVAVKKIASAKAVKNPGAKKLIAEKAIKPKAVVKKKVVKTKPVLKKKTTVKAISKKAIAKKVIRKKK